MQRDSRLYGGLIAAAVVAFAIMGLAMLVPGYDPVRQTVSEIGEAGSPAQGPFTVALCVAAAALLVFALGVGRAAREERQGGVGAWLIAFMAVPVAGVGVFSFPHPLHNLFGELELIGYLAPLAVAWGWRKDSARTGVSGFSWFMGALVWASVAFNLAYVGLLGPGVREAISTQLHPVYGLVQRSLFLAWFGWIAVLSILLLRREPRST